MANPDPARWAKLQTLLETALDLPPAERAALVTSTASVDPELATELASLLDASTRIPAFLDAPPTWRLGDDPEEDLVGMSIGPYRVVGELGRGGHGRVLLAERDDVGSRVAIKLVRGGLAAPELERRFLTERRVLASLDHPHIARLLDAGAIPGPSGDVPYLVMEAVEGVPLMAYVREHDLTVGERLALFAQICEAVQFAHRRLVVHRDLKPSNLLVTEVDGEPVVKLLDFGIAKLLDEAPETAETRTGQHLMTPEYAAPEQVLGEPITTSTDVYTLGVILYELLTGERPYEVSASLREVVRVVCDEMPPPPSTRVPAEAARRLRGDLDAIVCKALAKTPEERYESVEALADDLDRRRQQRPVAARRPSAGYRAQRFVRRHRGATAVGVLGALLVIAAVGREVVLRQQAERARDEIAATADLLTVMFDATTDAYGSEFRIDTLRTDDLLDRAAARLDTVPHADALIQGRLLLRLGQIYASLGLEARAATQYRAAADAFRPVFPSELADALYHIGINATASERCQEALDAFTEALTLRAAADLTAIAYLRAARAPALQCLGRSEEAVADARFAVGVFESGPDADGGSLHNLSYILERAGAEHLSEAIEVMSESVDRADARHPPGDPVITARRLYLSRLLLASGDSARAEGELRRAYRASLASVGPTHNRTLGAQGALAVLLAARGNGDTALSLARARVETARQLPEADVRDRVQAFDTLSEVLLAAGRPGPAEDAARQAVALLAGLDDWELPLRQGIYHRHAAALQALGRAADARAAEARAVEIGQELEARRAAP